MRNLLLLTLLLISTASFAQSEKGKGSKAYDFGASHIITFTPISGIVAFDNFNPGAGFDYEYIISRELGIGIHIPVMLGYAGPDEGYYGGGYYRMRHTSLFTAPGIRFHTGNRRKSVDFSTGASVLIGNMHFKPVVNENYYNVPPTPPVVPDAYDYSMFGLLADNSINFSRNNFTFGFNVRVGTMFEQRDDTRFFMQFGMHFGGIF